MRRVDASFDRCFEDGTSNAIVATVSLVLLSGMMLGCGNETDRPALASATQALNAAESVEVIPDEGPAPPLVAVERNGKWGFVNRRGELVLPAVYEHAIDFSEGIARVQQYGRLSFIDANGKVLFHLPPGARSTMRYTGGPVWYKSDDDLWGLCDRSGTVVVTPTYNDVRAFSDGVAAVNLGAKIEFPGFPDGGKWGYINRQGEVVIPIELDSAGDFSDGRALVGGRFIDKQGKTVIDIFQRFPDFGPGSIGNFREGVVAMVIDRSVQRLEHLTRYIDRQGMIVFEIEGGGGDFNEGLAVLGTRNKCGFVDRQGRVVIKPAFDRAQDFSDGLAAVKIGENWGYIDKTGTVVIAPEYNEVESFRGGAAKVHIGGELQEVLDVPWFWEGGEWWLIDKAGRRVAKIKSDPQR